MTRFFSSCVVESIWSWQEKEHLKLEEEIVALAVHVEPWQPATIPPGPLIFMSQCILNGPWGSLVMGATKGAQGQAVGTTSWPHWRIQRVWYTVMAASAEGKGRCFLDPTGLIWHRSMFHRQSRLHFKQALPLLHRFHTCLKNPTETRK